MVPKGVGTLGRRAHRCRDCNHVWVPGICRHVDSVAGGKKGIEALYEVWVTVEEHGNALDDAGGVDAIYWSE